MVIADTQPGKEATVRALGYPGVTDEVRKLPLTEILRPQEPYVTPGSIALFSADRARRRGGSTPSSTPRRSTPATRAAR